MCPHTTIYVSLYSYLCVRTCIQAFASAPLPVLVIDNYCENIKVLRHQMAPLGGKECRILGAGIDGKKPKAVAVFASLEQVRILLYVCPHSAMYVSSSCYI